MAKYYFCNGTTKKDLPCQNPVPKENDRCVYHRKDGGSSGRSIYSLLKTGLDALIYIHAASEAAPFATEVMKRVIEIFSSNFNIQANDIKELSAKLENEKAFLIRKINTTDESNIYELVAISNLAIGLMQNKGDFNKEVDLVPA